MRFSGIALRSRREAAGLTRETLACEIHKSHASITAYELGRGFPPANVIGDLAEALGCSTDDLFIHDDPPDVADWAAESRNAQGLPPQIEDPAALSAIGSLVAQKAADAT